MKKIFSTKLNKTLFIRSSWEEKIVNDLDNDQEIESFIYEPFSIRYENNKKEIRNYIPDLLITYKNGQQKLVEIKPEYLINTEKNLCKFDAARNYCQEKGLLFEIWTEKEIFPQFTE